MRSYLPSELRWQDFSSVLNSASPIFSHRLNRNNSVPPKKKTGCYQFQYWENMLPFASFIFFQLHSMIFILYLHHVLHAALSCDSRTKPISLIRQKIPSWKLMSKGEREITSKLNHFYRGRETQDAWCSRGEKSHVFKKGKTCSYLFVCISSIYFLWALILLCFSVPYLLPVSHARFRGSKTSKGRKFLNSLHIFTFGVMSISNGVLSTHSLHVIPVLVLLWFLLFALASRCICVI